jgi:hypothetical protein
VADFNPVLGDSRSSQGIDWPDSLQYSGRLVLPDGTDLSGPFRIPDNNPYSFPSVRGASVSVQQSLSNITFVPGTAGGMSSSIAYIRYWSKNGTSQRTTAGLFPQNGAVNDSQQSLLNDFVAVSRLNLGVGPQPQQVTEPSRTVLTTPTNTAYQSRPRQPVPTQTTSPPSSGPNFLQRLGSIFSANPGGSVAPAWQNPFFTPPAAPSPDSAVWQFLFNPEELQLSSGPDFNRAETWGVSDPANSGQPLSWRSNKNRKLTFGKVLLHGYSFGKRVDALEAGLQALFTAREGAGSDGPPVLEFVWGQRVFGPCVIQNIQVREKAWDKGLLVNAEVSFELEQVPEWTINDGFVDVLRPGRQSTVNDPLAAREGNENKKSDDRRGDEKKNEPGGGGGNRLPTISQCNNLSSDVEKWEKFIQRIEAKKSGVRLGSPSLISISGSLVESRLSSTFPGFEREYQSFRNNSRSNSTYGNRISKALGNDCLDLTSTVYGFNSSIAQNTSDREIANLNKFYNEILIKCSKIIKTTISSTRKELGCDGKEIRQDSRQLPRAQGGRNFQGPILP